MNDSPRAYESLSDALRDQQIPLDNHATIRAFCGSIGISRYLRLADSIKAVRRDGGPALEIHWGRTRGFVLETARGCLGAVKSGDLWYVAHPENRLPEFSRGSRSGLAKIECPVCHLQISIVSGRIAFHGAEVCAGSQLDLSVPEA